MNNAPSLTKGMILANLKTLPFVAGEMVISAGAALVLLGLRQSTSDVDATCGFEAFYSTVQTVSQQTGKAVALLYSYTYRVLIAQLPGEIDLHLEMDRRKLSREFREGLHLPGMPKDMRVLSPRALLEQKRKLNRPKDQADIKALQDYLARQP